LLLLVSYPLLIILELIYPNKYTLTFAPIIVFAHIIYTYWNEIQMYDFNTLKSKETWYVIQNYIPHTFIVYGVGAMTFYLIGIKSPDMEFAYVLIAASAVSVIFSTIVEEIIFRKIIFKYLYQKFNFYTGSIISSMLFAVGHANMTAWLGYFLIGCVWSYMYKKTNNIAVPIIMHIIWNLINFIILSMKIN
jgi:membrane protease YdiL (CAAX protease family)